MKKIYDVNFSCRESLKKKLRIMKLISLFILLGLMQVHANTYSQSARISLHMNNTELREIIKKIQENTDFTFFYSYEDIEGIKIEEVNIHDATLEEALIECLKNTDLNYEIKHNAVILVKEEKEAPRIEVTGKVTDSEGKPLPGATVLIKGTYKGVTTDSDGNYKITIPNSKTILAFSYVGHAKQEVTVGDKMIIDIVLKPTAASLEEVVVVGYGTQKKEQIGSAVSQVKAEEIEAKSVGAISFEQILGGQIKGVQITQASGAPGAAATIRIRGITSPFGGSNNQPLYVIDGVPFHTDAQFEGSKLSTLYTKTQNPLLGINPGDIESVAVLKDAGATAIYGSRGANGVILITTKKGQKNTGITTTLEYSLSLNNPIKKQPMLDAAGFKKLHLIVARNTLAAYNAGTASYNSYLSAARVIDPNTGEPRETFYDLSTGKNIPLFGDSDIYWQDEIYRKNAPVHQWNLNMSGGNEHTIFSLGLSHTDQKPLAKKSRFKQYGARLSIDSQVNKWLKIGSSLNYSGSRDLSPQQNTTQTYAGMYYRPDFPVYNEDGTFFRSAGYTINISPGTGLVYYWTPNPLAEMENEVILYSTAFIGNAYAEATLLKDLKVRASANAGIFKNRSRSFIPLRSQWLATWSRSTLNKSISENMNTSFNVQANYHTKINKHSIDLMAGTSWDKASYYRSYVNYSDLADDYVLTNGPSAATITGSGDSKAHSGINSLYSRAQYSYDGKYTATFNLRTDKSSKFGPGNKRAYFPSLAMNWNMNREKFLENLNFLDKLILRGSYGKSGSANVTDFAYLQFFEVGSGGDKEYEPGNTAIVPISTYPNTDIGWESTKEFNFGFDFSLFSNRIYGSFDIYDKRTSGILIVSPFPLESGASRFTSNLADVSNKGWELEVGADLIRTTDINWSITFNIAANRNKVENMEGHGLPAHQSLYYTVGEPIGNFKGYRVEKIIQTQAEIDALNAASPTGVYYNAYTGPGDYLYKDLNGDNRITAEDKETIGNLQPDYFGGFNTIFSYKRITIMASFHYSIGNEVEWKNYRNLINYITPGQNLSTIVQDNYWTTENTTADYPRLIYDYYSNGPLSDVSLQDASFLRLKMVRLNYEIPQGIINKLSLKSGSVYISATNLITWTSFMGIDPETGGTNMTIDDARYNRDAFPYSKTFSFGVKIGL